MCYFEDKLFKGGYLDFWYLIELKEIYIIEICIKKTIQIIKNLE